MFKTRVQAMQKKHKLSDILFIAIAAGEADCNTRNEIEDYAIAHEAFFSEVFGASRRDSLSRHV